MRVFAGALLAVLAAGPDLQGAGNLAVTLDAHPLARSCAVVSTAPERVRSNRVAVTPRCTHRVLADTR